MNLLEINVGWKKLEFWNQVGVASGVIAIVLAILALAGVQMHLVDLSLLFLFCGFGLLVYGNIQQSRKLADATDKLSKVDGRIDQASTSVYTQKNEEIRKLEMEVATFKDKAAGWQDKAGSWKEERDGFESANSELQELARKEHDRADKLQKALDSLVMAYKKREGISENTANYSMSISTVLDGSPEHLQRMDQKSLYERAQRLAREAGVEIPNQPD